MSSVAVGIIASIVYLGGSALVFVLGSSYYALFRTNKSWPFKLALVAAAIPAAWLLLRNDLKLAYGLLAFAFLAAASANVLGAAAGTWLPRPLRLRDDSLRGIALTKALEAVVVVAAILLLMLAFRLPLSEIYLKAGRLGPGLGIGVGGFVLFAVLAAGQARQMKIPAATIGRLVPWILLFVFANAFMEELWFRALFLGPMVSLVGPIAAIILTAAVFALAHIGATYMSKDERVRFLIILFPLGLAWGACLHYTGSILASALFHAGADSMIVNEFIASLHRSEAGSAAPANVEP